MSEASGSGEDKVVETRDWLVLDQSEWANTPGWRDLSWEQRQAIIKQAADEAAQEDEATP